MSGRPEVGQSLTLQEGGEATGGREGWQRVVYDAAAVGPSRKPSANTWGTMRIVR